MLVMMVIPLTRKRTQEHNSAPLRIQSVANGSSSEIVQQPTRKRNRRLPNVQANAAVAPIPQPAAVAPIPQAPIPQPDWDHLCDYWELESTMNYSRKMAINRGKQVIASRGGSRSIANHVFQMTDRETQMLPSPLEVYHKLHFNAKKQEWQNDDARIQYDNIIRHKEEAVAKLVSEGTTITTTMHHELENDAIQSVCAKEKTIKSAWKVGVGPVLRKKDFWMTSEAESSRPPSNENETLRNKVASLEKKSEEYEKKEERYEKLLMFMSSKFPDFESVISEPVSSGEVGMDEQLYEDNRSIDSLI
ncbi:hypothetical protein QVD17_00029 [Tagetes erecta]|uniref:Uncharacterized protein n=1 Tax=Tagetes erecta TaxID=13708 RepID=A0AAD8L493_TARER|nr:hypothetical protein QVD17_00029 [Tagetes erecta]